MDFKKYKELIHHRLAREYEFIDSETLQGDEYDEVAERSYTESISFAHNIENREICVVSYNCTEDFIRERIHKIPEYLLSGCRSILHDRSTILTCVFVMENIPFELIQYVKSFDFIKTEQKQHKSYMESRVILIEKNSWSSFTNKAASGHDRLFRVINPPEPLEGTIEETEN